MSGADDFLGDMPRFPFDDRDADAVFGGASGPDTVPEDLRDVAELVCAARRAGSADELVGEGAMRGGRALSTVTVSVFAAFRFVFFAILGRVSESFSETARLATESSGAHA